MNKLNQWLTLFANLGVLIGIFFLAYEVRQNTVSIQSQTRAALFAGGQEELWKTIEYPNVVVDMSPDDGELSATDKVRLDGWLTAAMRAREYAWTEYQSGNVDAEQWRSETAIIRVILGSKRTRHWWNNIARDTFREDFANEVDTLIVDVPESDYVLKVLAIE